MEKIIAIRKRDFDLNTKRTLGDSNQMREFSEKKVERIKQLDITYVPLGLSDPRKGGVGLKGSAGPRKGSLGYFTDLPLFGAFSFELTAEKRQKNAIRRELFRLLKAEYDLFPTSINSSVARSRDATSGSFNAGNARWPDFSGILKARDLGMNGENIVVGIIDSGVESRHEQFSEDRIEFVQIDKHPALGYMPVVARGVDPVKHGTHVCGIIGGNKTGILPKALLLVARITTTSYASSLEQLIAALEWYSSRIDSEDLRDKNHILNLSLGIDPRSYYYQKNKSIIDTAFSEVFQRLYTEFNVLIVAAIGNDGKGSCHIPGIFSSVLSVGAVEFVDKDNIKMCEFSSYGTDSPYGNNIQPDVVGSGVGIYSSVDVRNGESLYGHKTGSSMAAAYVSGIAGLYAQSTHLRGSELRSHIIEHCYQNRILLEPDKTGRGLVIFS